MLQVDLPIGQGPGALDGFLEQGWFGNGYLLAFTPLICLRGDVYVTVPIRAPCRTRRRGP